ncbi:MAG: FMN-dependent NADH-azoreductase [Hyphomicrobiales bacterium]|jgi:FMN-dependent NADH-azoreductase|nr:FMN-dependent NADH-azoreductase [Hyphomicrobiales bacterium]
MNILFVTSSSRGSASYSNRVATNVLSELRSRDPAARVTVRDVGREPLPHINDDFVTATRGATMPQTDEQRALLARSEAMVDELFAADVIVIAAPMINFTIPSNLKAWIDYVARAGRTFRYSEKGPEGLVKGKQVIIVAARGGVYADNPAFDFQLPYLKSVLGFLGMTDVTVLEVEGTAYGPEAAEKAVVAATAKLHVACEQREAAVAA